MERVIKKNTLAAKTFLFYAILFVVTSGHSRLSRSGEMHVKAGYVLTLLAG